MLSGRFCSYFLSICLQLQKINSEQKVRIAKTERALQVAEVCWKFTKQFSCFFLYWCNLS